MEKYEFLNIKDILLIILGTIIVVGFCYFQQEIIPNMIYVQKGYTMIDFDNNEYFVGTRNNTGYNGNFYFEDGSSFKVKKIILTHKRKCKGLVCEDWRKIEEWKK